MFGNKTVLDLCKILLLRPYDTEMELENAKPFYMETDSLITLIKTHDFHKYVAEDVKKLVWHIKLCWEKTKRLLPVRKNKKATDLMKDERGVK